jgi:hypothetical protein
MRKSTWALAGFTAGIWFVEHPLFVILGVLLILAGQSALMTHRSSRL